VLDELVVDQIPVLSGGGRRLFERLPKRIELEIVRLIDPRMLHTPTTVSATGRKDHDEQAHHAPCRKSEKLSRKEKSP
jgi:hypothetical protein